MSILQKYLDKLHESKGINIPKGFPIGPALTKCLGALNERLIELLGYKEFRIIASAERDILIKF